jgi:hypothetical protein
MPMSVMPIYRQSQHGPPFLAAGHDLGRGRRRTVLRQGIPPFLPCIRREDGYSIHAVFEALYELPRSVARRATPIADCRWLWWWQRDQFQQRNGNRFTCDSLSSYKWPSDIASYGYRCFRHSAADLDYHRATDKWCQRRAVQLVGHHASCWTMPRRYDSGSRCFSTHASDVPCSQCLRDLPRCCSVVHYI